MINLTNSVSSMTESRDERPLPSNNTPEYVKDWEVDKDNKCSTASNKATGTSAGSADQVCCRINDHDDELILDNSGISLSEAAVVNEARTVVTSEDNQQEYQVDEAALGPQWTTGRSVTWKKQQTF